MRAPVATVGFLTLVAISVGLVTLGTVADRTARAVAADGGLRATGPELKVGKSAGKP